MSACIFCEIVKGAIPCRKAFESDDLLAFHDIKPQAPIHVQIIPRAHIASVNDLDPSHAALLGKMTLTAKTIAAELGAATDGYRLVVNCGSNGGQEVPHLHLHLLAGRKLGWPPG